MPLIKGAKMQYLAANVVDSNTGKPVLPPYAVEKVHGVPVAFIGAILKDTPTIVTASGAQGLTFLDEATSINQYVSELKQEGVKSIVVLLH